MTIFTRISRAAVLTVACGFLVPALTATAAELDVNGGQDHPLIKRFTGSWLFGYKSTDWDQAVFPTGLALRREDSKWATPLTVEGKVTREFYLAPIGKTPLEVFRNYEQALTAAGFKRKFGCESSCGDFYYAMHSTLAYATGVTWADGRMVVQGGDSWPLTSGLISAYQGRFWYGTLPRNGQEIHVLLYTSLAEREYINRTATFLQIAEPKAMPTGQVQVDATALGQGLIQSGKVALYGLYFDTGKADIKPESRPQLAEMAKLLQSQPTLRVFIVGHTDNQGSSDANMTLSLQRAQSAVNALTTDYKVDAKRVAARGVGSLAPLASNTSEDGRGRNRRVELVMQ